MFFIISFVVALVLAILIKLGLLKDIFEPYLFDFSEEADEKYRMSESPRVVEFMIYFFFCFLWFIIIPVAFVFAMLGGAFWIINFISDKIVELFKNKPE